MFFKKLKTSISQYKREKKKVIKKLKKERNRTEKDTKK